MKVLILAGGLGSRLSEETELKPKPMIEIGGKPILWHIMKIYSHFGYNEFVILLGYKGYIIKEYIANYYMHNSDITFNMKDNSVEILNNNTEPWKVTLIDTGLDSMTGGRIKRARWFVGNEPFMVTYGDGVSNVDIPALVEFHKKHKKIITVTSVQPEGRFGSLIIDKNDRIIKFQEKPKGDDHWVNGGFFVCQPEVFDYIDSDSTIFEKEPLENLARDGQLYTYRHHDFWKPMDTIRDKKQLEELIQKGNAPWMLWEK
jgi:glucose-1-phosphate cytidylyltransferase